MRRWNRTTFLISGGILLVTVAATGCKMKTYEPVEVPVTVESQMGDMGDQTAVLSANQAGNVAAVQAGEAESMAAAPAQMADSTVSSSPVKAELTTETAPTMESRDETVYVTNDNVNVRTQASPSAEVITRLSAGAELKRIGYSETWSQVVYQDQTCYISSQYISTTMPEAPAETTQAAVATQGNEEIKLNMDWKYASFAKITSGTAVLYRSEAANRKGKVICVNAGHGTSGGSNVKTQCHPDGTPKVTGGTTGAGATTAVAVSSGMQFSDGTPEAKVTLAMAKVLKDKLLARGYDVLMIRESDDVQLDNIARTVIANNKADCHIALHWDSTTSNKGAFYMSVPNVSSYRSMEPVASHWQEHNVLGESLIAGLKGAGVKIFSGGSMEMDLTQTSYSTVPSIDIELGDKASDHSAATLDSLGTGLADGIDKFFGVQ